MINFLRIFGTRGIKIEKHWPIFSNFNPFPSMPSVASGDRRQKTVSVPANSLK